MIQTNVPKDLRTYKTKMIGPFTLRQLVCVSVAAVLDILLYSCLFKPMDLPMDYLIYAVVILDLPILAFTTFPQGVPFEKFLGNLIIHNFIAPTKRKPVSAVSALSKKPVTKKEKKSRDAARKKAGKQNKRYTAYK